MKRVTGEAPHATYRTVKFEIHPDQVALTELLRVSENLREVYNSALVERQEKFNTHIAPMYECLKMAENGTREALREELKNAYREHSVTLIDQINALTPRRKGNELFASVTRNFQEETLDRLNGAYLSFLKLRKNGDYDAKAPRLRDAGFFQKIPGRSGYKVKDGVITISTGTSKLSFPIPEYQQKQLASAKRIKKFELYRTPSNLSEPGIFEISIAYEIETPATTRFDPETAVYLALGASALGIISPSGEEVIHLWRSDKYWQPKIERVLARMENTTRNSRAWKRLNDVRREMQVRAARQRQLDEREVADYLIKRHGRHFVVTELVIRSKEGKLADSDRPERGGSLGLNWSAQNTGSLGRLVLWLSEKVKEHGGSVRKHKLVLTEHPKMLSTGGKLHSDKLWMAEKLRESFLETLTVGMVE